MLGATFTVTPIKVRRRTDQLDNSGSLHPFFPRSPGPPFGGNAMLGAMGPAPPFSPILPSALVGYAGQFMGGVGFHPSYGYYYQFDHPSSTFYISFSVPHSLNLSTIPLNRHHGTQPMALTWHEEDNTPGAPTVP